MKVEDYPIDDSKAKYNYCGKTYACHSKRNRTSIIQNHFPSCPKNSHKYGPLDRYQQTLIGEATLDVEVRTSDGSTLNSLVTYKYSEKIVR